MPKGKFKKKKSKGPKIFIAVFTALIMILSIFGITMNQQDNSNSIVYNGFGFDVNSERTRYITTSEGNVLEFYVLPSYVDSINVSVDIISLLKNSKYWIVSFDPDYEQNDLVHIDLARFELPSRVINKQIGIINAVSENSPDYDLPVLGCDNSSLYMPVIYFNVSNSTKIYEKDSCIIIQGQGQDFIILMDRLLYGFYGIITEESIEEND
ncbi:hypothetical protein JXB41_01805 [Candidatus Woesearchaeota archaeon]|nr:hypothetical protein [Candidatus Woesearchaeota archaeon]